ncbi:MAG: hypothetical protein CMF50_03105 [Legionellales bacterium]|nr:hypothetical protein [Legionellales bacterium]
MLETDDTNVVKSKLTELNKLHAKLNEATTAGEFLLKLKLFELQEVINSLQDSEDTAHQFIQGIAEIKQIIEEENTDPNSNYTTTKLIDIAQHTLDYVHDIQCIRDMKATDEVKNKHYVAVSKNFRMDMATDKRLRGATVMLVSGAATYIGGVCITLGLTIALGPLGFALGAAGTVAAVFAASGAGFLAGKQSASEAEQKIQDHAKDAGEEAKKGFKSGPPGAS